jgi:hypothetical protein
MLIQLEILKPDDIKEEFSLFYRYLKIELEPIGQNKQVLPSSSFEIKSNMSIAEVRELFVDGLNMFPTIFRKKNDEWIDISKDSTLSLKEENEIGRRECEAFELTNYNDFLETEF